MLTLRRLINLWVDNTDYQGLGPGEKGPQPDRPARDPAPPTPDKRGGEGGPSHPGAGDRGAGLRRPRSAGAMDARLAQTEVKANFQKFDLEKCAQSLGDVLSKGMLKYT